MGLIEPSVPRDVWRRTGLYQASIQSKIAEASSSLDGQMVRVSNSSR